MKRLITVAVAGLFSLTACNRDTSDPDQEVPTNPEDSRISVVSGTDLNGQLLNLNSSFQLNPKAAAGLEYVYKNYATPPNVNPWDDVTGTYLGVSTATAATSVSAVNDVVFVTWHIEGANYGGAVSAYKLNPATDTYEYTSVITFDDTDFHEATAVRNPASGHYEVFVVGQRPSSTSGYTLNSHNGAIVGKILYNYITDQFESSTTYKELPLPSYGANGIITSGGKYYIVTGNGQGGGAGLQNGGLYVVDYNLTNVSEAASLTDGEMIAFDPFTASPSNVDYSVLERGSSLSLTLHTGMNSASTVTNGFWPSSFTTSGSQITQAIDFERQGLAYMSSDTLLVAAGRNGLFYAVTAGASTGFIDTVDDGAYSALGVAYDDAAKVIYCAASDNGLPVIAGNGYPGGVLINTFDVVGYFVPPTGSGLPSSFNVKDVSVYWSDYIAIATGDAGVYFVKKNNI